PARANRELFRPSRVAGPEPFAKVALMARRALRSAQHTNLPAATKSQLATIATSRAAKTAYVVVGTAGLAALAIAIFGPKRFQREILRPVQNAVGDQASQLWADARPL